MAWTDACNAGLCARVDELKEQGMSERKCFPVLEDDQKEHLGEVVYSANVLRSRYKYLKGGRKPTTPSKKYGQPPGPREAGFTQANQIAIFVISHLERIMLDDPKAKEAINKVNRWTHDRLNELRLK